MVVEVTCRTVHGRFLLKPSPELNRLAIGVLARAQSRYPVRIHALCIMSNHYHLLLTVTDPLQLARFMNFVQSNLAREAGRLNCWRERFWSRRYQAILVSDERDAQLSRLRYILSQGCKEGIVERPEHWQGVHCVRELLGGTSQLQGKWIDRTAMYRKRGRGRKPTTSTFASVETLVLSRLPCFEGCTPIEEQTWIRNCVDQIVTEARLDRARRRKTSSCGSQRDQMDPTAMKRTPAPWFHVASRSWACELRDGYAGFVDLFRAAAQRLRRGLEADFPVGCFPPAQPYVMA
jgi:REP element-mobilizing transposase RayT